MNRAFSITGRADVEANLRLLRLAPDLQDSIANGEAAMLSVKNLQDLARTDDFEAQRQGFRAALDAARARPDGRRSRKAGKLTAAPPQPAEPSSPPQLHAVERASNRKLALESRM